MDKSITKNRVAAVRSYLAGIGATITQVQGYEVVARAQGFENKHVLASAGNNAENAVANQGHSAASAVSVIEGVKYVTSPTGQRYRFFDDGDAPMSVEEMRAANWQLKAVVAIDTDVISDIEARNDQASKIITGIDYALCGIDYEVFPYHYGNAAVAMLVDGFIEEPDQVFNLDNEETEISAEDTSAKPLMPENPDLMPRADLRRLSQLLARVRDGKARFFTTLYDGVPHEHKMVWAGDDHDFAEILPNLHEIYHAKEQGFTYWLVEGDSPVDIDFDAALDIMVFEHIDSHLNAWEDDGEFMLISDIAYGRRVSDLAWEFKGEDGTPWRLGFDFDQTKFD